MVTEYKNTIGSFTRNLLLQSKALGTTPWADVGSIVSTDNNGTGPTGAVDACLLDSVASGDSVTQDVGTGAWTGDPILTFSVYVLNDTATSTKIKLTANSTSPVETTIEINWSGATATSVETTSQGAGVHDYYLRPVNPEHGLAYRRAVVNLDFAEAAATATKVTIEIIPDNDGDTGQAHFWGAQLEEGPLDSEIQHQTNVDLWTGDYADIADWKASTETIDLVAADERYVGMLLPGTHVLPSGGITFTGNTTDVTRYRHLTTTQYDSATYPQYDDIGHRYLPEKLGPHLVEMVWADTGDESGIEISEEHFRLSNIGLVCNESTAGVTAGNKIGVEVMADDVIVYQTHVIGREGIDVGAGSSFAGVQVGDSSGPAFIEDVVLREVIVQGSPEGKKGLQAGVVLNLYTKRGEIYNCAVSDVTAGNARGFHFFPSIQGSPLGTDNVKLYNCWATNCLNPVTDSGACFFGGALYSDDSVDPSVKGFGYCVCTDNSLRATNWTGDGSFADNTTDPDDAHKAVAGYVPGAVWGVSPTAVMLNSAAQDYHPRGFSPCLDAGTDLTTEFDDATKGPGSTRDFEDTLRGTGLWDIGPYFDYTVPSTTTAATELVYSIGSNQGIDARHYSTIQLWLDGIGRSPVADNERIIGELYAESAFVLAATQTIKNHVTSRLRSITLRANSEHRRDPVAKAGALVQHGDIASNPAAFDIRAQHVRLEGFGIEKTTTGATAERAVMVRGADAALDALFLEWDDGSAADNKTIEVVGNRATLSNCVGKGSATTNKGPVTIFATRDCDRAKIINCIADTVNGNHTERIGFDVGLLSLRPLVANSVGLNVGTGNKATYTSAIGGTDWTAAGTGSTSLNTGDTTDPDGGNTASKLDDTGGGDYFTESQSWAGETLVVGKEYSVSVHFKEGTSDDVRLWFSHLSPISDRCEAQYKWSTGVLTLVQTGVVTEAVATVELLENGWIRLALTMPYLSGHTGLQYALYAASNGTADTGTAYAWGMQAQRGPVTAYRANLTTVPIGDDFKNNTTLPDDGVMTHCASRDTSARGLMPQLMFDDSVYFLGASSDDYRIGPTSPAFLSGLNTLLFVPRDFASDARTAPVVRGVFAKVFAADLVYADPLGPEMVLAQAVEVIRADGTVVRVTSNSEPVTYDGFSYTPDAAAAMSAVRSELGFRPTSADISGAISADAITAEDMAAGLYDNAKVIERTIDPSQPWKRRVFKRVFRLGKIQHEDNQYSAQMSGVMTAMREVTGSRVAVECDYLLGSGECGVDLSDLIEYDLRIESVTDQTTFAAHVDDINATRADDYFGNGTVLFFTGSNAGLEFRVKSYTKATRLIVLTAKAPLALAVGDRFQMTPGCWHRYTLDCVTKWTNGRRFGGAEAFPGTGRTKEDAL